MDAVPTCTNCGARTPLLRRGQFDTIRCTHCEYIMPVEGVPDAPDDILCRDAARSYRDHPSRA